MRATYDNLEFVHSPKLWLLSLLLLQRASVVICFDSDLHRYVLLGDTIAPARHYQLILTRHLTRPQSGEPRFETGRDVMVESAESLPNIARNSGGAFGLGVRSDVSCLVRPLTTGSLIELVA